MAKIVISALVALLHFGFILASNNYPNKFHSIYGCKQMNTNNNYNEPVTYLPLEKFEHVGIGTNYTFFRIGVFGSSDAIIRFSKVPMPYNNDIVHEIVIGARANNFIEVRRQTRFNALLYTNNIIKQMQTPNVLSETEPFVMRMEFNKNGTVLLTKDNESKPFLEFFDRTANISSKYVGFSNWLSKTIYFFDCPMYNYNVRADLFNV